VVREPHQVRRLIGLTGQYASVDETLTGTENLYLIGRLTGLSRQQARLRAAELLTQFSLTEAAGRAARTYSGGMRRRLDLAASLVARPRVLYLDERSSP
jgi:oleandomycin transport system ATP-binding protein